MEGAKYYFCQNRPQCELARSGAPIALGWGAAFNCPLSDPDCLQKNLVEIKRKGSSSMLMPILLVLVLLLLCAGGGAAWWFLMGPASPAKKSQAMIGEAMPWLKQN